MTKLEAAEILKPFINVHQLLIMNKSYSAEEFVRLATTINIMPKTYAQDGMGDDAVVYLHYFYGSWDWWITEKDCDPDGQGQTQAFGLVSNGNDNPELGYISIVELTSQRKLIIELDLYWTPKTLAEIKAKRHF